MGLVGAFRGKAGGALSRLVPGAAQRHATPASLGAFLPSRQGFERLGVIHMFVAHAD
jgi:alkaline phosphatase